MRKEEAEYIAKCLEKIESNKCSPCLNLGSSTSEYRDKKKHINQFVFRPLLARNINVIHSDLKDGVGVDIVGNIYDENIQNQFKKLNVKLLLCNNILEHITDPVEFSNILDDVLSLESYLFVTVPYSYPIHLDPIDTNFRPSPQQIAELFPNFTVEKASIIECGNYLSDLIEEPKKVIVFIKRCLTLFNPFLGKKKWKIKHHRMLWLFKKYKVTCVLLKKT